MVFTLGESLLDIIINSPDDAFVRPGGAMLNTAVSLGRSGIEVSLITELGDDTTAGLITDFLNENNVKSHYIRKYNDNNTSLALAFLDENKKPSYTFMKNYPESRDLLEIHDFDSEDILLFGSLYSVDTDIRKSIVSNVEKARQNNVTVIYDPNIRNPEHLKDKRIMNAVIENIKYSDIIKGSDEDMTNIFGDNDLQTQLRNIRDINRNALIIITLGPDGVIADYNGKQIKLSAMETNVISTIGAGDAFNAGIIYALFNTSTEKRFNNIEPLLKSGLRFSARVCASKDNYISID